MENAVGVNGVSEAVRQIACEMRADMTTAEAALWGRLRNKQLNGLRFRAQHPVGRFVVDFYCASRKLVVEVDGGIHNGRGEQDSARSEHLEAYGYTIIRFTNEEVMSSLDAVIDTIREVSAALPVLHGAKKAHS